MKVLVYQFHLESNTSFSVLNEKTDRHVYGNYWQLSSSTCSAYAKKYGFDYIFENPNDETWKPYAFNQPQFDQFKAITFLDKYDAVLWIDSDILITPDADNIIEKYNDGYTNIVALTGIGARLNAPNSIMDKGRYLGTNTGVVIYYKKTRQVECLYKLKLQHFLVNSYATQCSYLIDNLDPKTKWWEKWEIFKPFLQKYQSGFYNDDKFFTFILALYSLPFAHLDIKYNYMKISDKIDLFKSDAPQFLHFTGENKIHMNKYFDLIENTT